MNLYDLLASRFPADRSKPCFLLSDGSAISYGALEEGAARVAGRPITVRMFICEKPSGVVGRTGRGRLVDERRNITAAQRSRDSCVTFP